LRDDGWATARFGALRFETRGVAALLTTRVERTSS
jgi:hypothetical protein